MVGTTYTHDLDQIHSSTRHLNLILVAVPALEEDSIKTEKLGRLLPSQQEFGDPARFPAASHVCSPLMMAAAETVDELSMALSGPVRLQAPTLGHGHLARGPFDLLTTPRIPSDRDGCGPGAFFRPKQ